MDIKQERMQLLERQIERLQRRVNAYTPRSNLYSWLRVALFFGGLVLAAIVGIVSSWWIGLIVFAVIMVVFAIVAHYHRQVEASISRHTLWRYIKSAHVARMRLDWEQIPAVDTPIAQEDHPFSYDLDITGNHSLFRLLNTAISRDGSQRLLSWLLNRSPEPEVIRQRQAIVQELVPMTRFRDRLILNALIAARRSSDQLEGQRLLKWLNQQEAARSLRTLLIISTALNVLTLVLFLLGLFLPIPQLWEYSLGAGIILFFLTANQRGDLFDDASYLRYSFATLSTIFTFLEKYPYGGKVQLSKLCAPFFQDRQHGPSSILQGMARISAAATLKKNALLWFVVNALIPWDFYCAYRLNQYKAALSTRLPAWLDTWFELEALCSLAAFAYLNPEYTQPVLSPKEELAEEQRPIFSGKGLGHPLIPDEQRVSNDFVMNKLGEIVIITGSNMAGKSTFLRTLGVNLCLAYAGSVVNASSFRSSFFRLFTCIRVTDSVTDGYSYFYAEVRRLHALLEELRAPGQYPLFFLVDEIFKGTNNRERLIGSRSFVRALVGQNCIGLISTHDLELVTLADTLPQVSNDHFREDVVDGHMVFDYVLRPGPSPTTNALKIMAMEGLPVDVV